MRSIAVRLIGIVLLAMAPQAMAFGPGVHIREADRFAEAMRAAGDPLGDLLLGQNQPYLHLGANIPDMAWLVDSIQYDSHDRDFALFLVEVANNEGVPWKQALAYGNLIHLASDASAEVFLTPRLSVKGALGVIDVARDYPELATGENEHMTEALGDLVNGNLDALVRLVYLFAVDQDASPAGLLDAMRFILDGAEVYFGPQNREEVLDDVEELVAVTQDQFQGVPEIVVQALLDGALLLPLDEMLDFLLESEITPLEDMILAILGNPKPTQLDQFLDSPWVKEPDFYEDYDNLLEGQAGAIAQDYLDLGILNPHWPIWRFETIVAGNIVSLNSYLQEIYEPNLEQGIFDVFFLDPLTGEAITEIPSNGPPDEVVAVAEVFNIEHVTQPLVVRVLADGPGAGRDPDRLVAWGEAVIDHDPFLYGRSSPLRIEVPFAPADSLQGALGFIIEVARLGPEGPEASPAFFSTSWDAYTTIDVIDVARPNYILHFSTYDHWPRSLRVVDPLLETDSATLKVRVSVAPDGPGLPGAQVIVADMDSFLTGLTGSVLVSPVPGGDRMVSAHVQGYGPVDRNIFLTPGEVQVVNLPLHAIPQVMDKGDFQPYNDHLNADWDVRPFQGEDRAFYVWAGTTPGGADLVPETLAKWPGAMRLDLSADPLPDGTKAYIAVQAEYWDGTRGLVGVSDGITVNLPEPPEGGCGCSFVGP